MKTFKKIIIALTTLSIALTLGFLSITPASSAQQEAPASVEATTPEKNYMTFAQGTCVSGVGYGSVGLPILAQELKETPCHLAHDAVVLDVDNDFHPNQIYPASSFEDTEDWEFRLCHVDVLDTSRSDHFLVFPSRAEWEEGNKTVVCFGVPKDAKANIEGSSWVVVPPFPVRYWS